MRSTLASFVHGSNAWSSLLCLLTSDETAPESKEEYSFLYIFKHDDCYFHAPCVGVELRGDDFTRKIVGNALDDAYESYKCDKFKRHWFSYIQQISLRTKYPCVEMEKLDPSYLTQVTSVILSKIKTGNREALPKVIVDEICEFSKIELLFSSKPPVIRASAETLEIERHLRVWPNQCNQCMLFE